MRRPVCAYIFFVFDDNKSVSNPIFRRTTMFYLLLRLLSEERASGRMTDDDYLKAVSQLEFAHRRKRDGHTRWKMTKNMY